MLCEERSFSGFRHRRGFSSGLDGKASACHVGDPGSIPRLGRSPEEGNGSPLQCFAWKTPWTEEPGGLQSMGSQSQTRLSDFPPKMWEDLLEAAVHLGKLGFRFCTPFLVVRAQVGPLSPRALTSPSDTGKTTSPGWKEFSLCDGKERQRLRQGEAKSARWLSGPGLLGGRQVGHRAGWSAEHGTGRLQPRPGPGWPPGERSRALQTRRGRPCVHQAKYRSWSGARGAARTLGEAEEVPGSGWEGSGRVPASPRASCLLLTFPF